MSRSTDERLTHFSQALRIGFPLVSTAVVCWPKLSFGARLTYALICGHAYGHKDRSFPSQERLAYFLNRRRETVSLYIQELQEADLIEVRKNRKDGKIANNIYVIKKIPIEMEKHHKKYF